MSKKRNTIHELYETFSNSGLEDPGELTVDLNRESGVVISLDEAIALIGKGEAKPEDFEVRDLRASTSEK